MDSRIVCTLSSRLFPIILNGNKARLRTLGHAKLHSTYYAVVVRWRTCLSSKETAEEPNTQLLKHGTQEQYQSLTQDGSDVAMTWSLEPTVSPPEMDDL